MTHPIKTMADSSVMQVVARLAMLMMPVVTGILGYLGVAYLDSRFAEIRARADDAAATAAATAVVATQLTNRIDVIDANIASGSADRIAFQKQMSEQVNKLTDVVQATSNQVSAIGATLADMKAQSGRQAAVPLSPTIPLPLP